MHWQIGKALFGMIVNIILSAYTALVISKEIFFTNNNKKPPISRRF